MDFHDMCVLTNSLLEFVLFEETDCRVQSEEARSSVQLHCVRGTLQDRQGFGKEA